jgi:hypothetical protein
MLILRRFSHRHSRTFFIPNCKKENPLNECEKPIKQYREWMKPVPMNPQNECEKLKKQYGLNNANKMPVKIYVHW